MILVEDIMNTYQGTVIKKISYHLLGNQYLWGEPHILFLRNPIGLPRTSYPLVKPQRTVNLQ